MASATTSDPATTDADGVTAQIRDAIVTGEFAPHQRLIEADLSERFAASRAAVRAALLTLSGEGIIERLPNRGARVRAITLDEAIEIVEVRGELEALCARKAAENLTDDAADELRRLRAAIERSVEEGNLLDYTRINQELDRLVRRLSAHSTAVGLLERLIAQSTRHQFRLAFLPGRAAVSAPEHIAIIDAVLARDPDAADAATRAHLRSVEQVLRAQS